MLPKTTQATHTEVEGNTTVELTGTNGQGESLQELNAQDQEEQTAAPTTEEVKPVEEQGEVETNLSDKTPRFERRTEKLIDTLKAKTDEASELRKQLESLKVQPVPIEQNANLPPWLQDQVPQGEISLDDYRAQVADTARNLVKTELGEFARKSAQVSSFEKDLLKVESKYPILNQDSETYDKEKAKTVAELYSKASTADPSLGLADFVDKMMSFHQAGQEVGQKEIKASVIKRDAQAAVTPTPNTGDLPTDGPDWDSMSLKEKEKWMKDQGIWDK
jgi:hypothetical protein